MKKLLLVGAMVLKFFSVTYGQSAQWASSGGSLGLDFARSVCIDSSQNIYIIGDISAPYACFYNDTFSVSGQNDIFISKYNSSGILQWAKNFGGSYNGFPVPKTETGHTIAYCSATNSVYAYGSFIGSYSIDTFNLAAPAANDEHIFLTRFDLDGNCLWAKAYGSSADDIATGLACSENGTIYIAGAVKDSALFGSQNVGQGGFLANCSSEGEVRWVKKIFNSSNNSSGASGAIKSIRMFDGDLFFSAFKLSDSIYIDTLLIVQENSYPSVLARFDTVGNIKWAKLVGSPAAFTGLVDVDTDGNVYMVSEFGTSAIVGQDTLLANSSTDFFIVKYDSAGNYKWARQSGATSGASAIGCSTDGDGNVYVIGNFSGSAMFGSAVLNSNSSQDMFLVRYNKDGDFLGVYNTGVAIGQDVVTMSNGSAAVVGQFLDSTQFSNTTLVSKGSFDVYIAVIDQITGVGGQGSRIVNNELLIYANPSAGICNIVVPEDFVFEESLILTIIDIAGKVVSQTNISEESEIMIDIQQEAKGIYHAILSNGRKSYNGKIIFE